MANVVEVVLQAKDQASAVIDKTTEAMKDAATAAKSLDSSLDIKSQLGDLTGEFDKLKVKLQEGAEAEKQVTAATKEMAAENKEAEKSADAMGTTFGRLKGILVGYLSIRTFSALIDNIKEAQDAAAQLSAAYKSTGDTVGLTRDRLDEIATEMQRTTVYSDDLVKSAEAILLTFDNVRKDAFERTITAAADLGARMGTDLPSAARLLGRALQEPEQGLASLRRAGITFTDAQKDLVSALADTGDVAGAQNIILSALEERLGGAAVAARDTLGGALAGLKNSFGDLFESTEQGTQSAVNAINELSTTLASPEIKAGIDVLIAGLTTLVGWAITFASEMAKGVQSIGAGLANFATGGEQTTTSALQAQVDDQEIRVRRAERSAQVRNTEAAREELQIARDRLDTLKQALALSKASYTQTKQQGAATKLEELDFVKSSAKSNLAVGPAPETAAQIRERIANEAGAEALYYATLASYSTLVGDLPTIEIPPLELTIADPEVAKAELTELGSVMEGIWQGVGQSIQSSMSDMLYNAEFSLSSLTDLFRRAFADISAAIISSQIKDLLVGSISGGSSSGGFLGGLLGSVFGTAAGGGEKYGPTLVGEDGPEVAMAGGSGMRVWNMRQLGFGGGSGGGTFAPQYNVTIAGAQNDEQMRGQLLDYVNRKSAQDFQEYTRMLERNGYGRLR